MGKRIEFFGGRFASSLRKSMAVAAALAWAEKCLAHYEKETLVEVRRGHAAVMAPGSDGMYRTWIVTPDGSRRSYGWTLSDKTRAEIWADHLEFFGHWLKNELGEEEPADNSIAEALGLA